MKDAEYVLKMDAETAKIVSHACELYARILMGQFQVIQHLTLRPTGKGDTTFGERIDQCADGLLQARKAAFPELGGWGNSYGVGHDRGADTAWHTYEALRHTIAWNEHPEGGITVDFDRPMRFSDAPMPKCEVAGENAQEPQLLTLEEACSDIDCCWLEVEDYETVWVSDCVIMPNRRYVLIERLGYDPVSFKPEEYGRTWRCWNTKPTDEQREATPWQ